MYNLILNEVSDKFSCVYTDLDFEYANGLPSQLQDWLIGSAILTSDIKVFSNLNSKNFHNVTLLRGIFAYYDNYQQIAFIRGHNLDYLRKTFGVV
jgi:hypothetical protein